MRVNSFLPVLLVVGLMASLNCGCRTRNDAAEVQPTMADSIGQVLEYQLTNYPTSQYCDVYKNFMQDFFGPGHILADTAAASRYLRSELELDVPFEGPLYEKTGFKGNFYRVNLSAIRDGLIPYDVFFNAFVESVQGIEPPASDDWMTTWSAIDSVIVARGHTFPDEEADRERLKAQFEQGNFIAHHSARYNSTVNFHYRIISREKFDSIILPYLSN